MLTHYVKVVINRKAIYLEQARYTTKGRITFLSGYQVDKWCEPISSKRDTLHIIGVGTNTGGSLSLFKADPNIKIYACDVDKHYGEIVQKGRIQ